MMRILKERRVLLLSRIAMIFSQTARVRFCYFYLSNSNLVFFDMGSICATVKSVEKD